MKTRLLLLSFAAVLAAPASAKLPPPSDEAKAKAAEAAARTGWTNKVADYKLCQAADRVAATYLAQAKAGGKDVKPPLPTPPCTDPGPFAYTPPEARPIEAAGAHSPAKTATEPPSTAVPASTTTPTPGKK
jgi:hypothetical protein